MRKIFAYILYIVAILSAFIASGIKETADWQVIARPYFIIFAVSICLALTLTHIESIRRITYPALVCVCAWSYSHKIVITDFTNKTYRLYKWKNMSYRNLFHYVQDLFDLMYS